MIIKFKNKENGLLKQKLSEKLKYKNALIQYSLRY